MLQQLGNLSSLCRTCSVAWYLPVAAFHTRRVLLQSPLASHKPSGLIATLMTRAEWPCVR